MIATMADAKEMLVAAVSGGFGSGVAKIFTYPLEISKMRLMNKPSRQTSAECIQELLRTGWYVGFKEKVLKSFTQKFIYFYLYEALLISTMRITNSTRKLSGFEPMEAVGTVQLLASGYLGEALSIPISAPLEYVAVRVQTSLSKEGPMQIIKETIRDSGMKGFYRGWEVYLLCAFQPMIQFTIIERMKAVMLRGKDRTAVLSAAQAFWLGALTKAVASSITYPINLGRVIIQGNAKRNGCSNTSGAIEDDSSSNIVTVLRNVVRQEGAQGLFKGLGNEVVEGIIGAALLLMVKEKVTVGVRGIVTTAWK